MKNNKKYIISVAATFVIVAIFMSFSTLIFAQDCVVGKCVKIEVGGENYELKGDAYQAYLELENRILPYHSMRLHEPYLLSNTTLAVKIEGNSIEVESLVGSYLMNITKKEFNEEKTWSSVYGSLSKANLSKFLSVYDPTYLKSKSIYIYPLGGIEGNDGTFFTFSYVTTDQSKQISLDLKEIKTNEINRIIMEEDGTTKLIE